MKTSHSTLAIPAWKRAYISFINYAVKHKIHLIIAMLVLVVPIVFGLAFAEGVDKTDKADETSEIVEIEPGEKMVETVTEEAGSKPEVVEEVAEEETAQENTTDNEGATNASTTEQEFIPVLDKKFQTGGTKKTNIPHVRNGQSINGSSLYRATLKASPLPAVYDSRTQSFASGIKIKNQNTEGLCWAYAGSTIEEYYIAKHGLASIAGSTISPKHFDYLTLKSDIAYKTEDVVAGKKNALFDRTWGAAILYDRVTPGDAGNLYHAMYSLSYPYGTMTESDFMSAAKTNDPRLNGLIAYSDIWSSGLDTVVINNNVYAEKQKYDAMNNGDTSNIVATGAKVIDGPLYGVNTNRESTIEAIKSAIYNYGAVEVSTYYDPANCMSHRRLVDANNQPFVAEDGRYIFEQTIIDKTASDRLYCDPNSGHALTLVGWNDYHSYVSDGETKIGAFIVQNSYGDDPIFTYISNTETIEAHLHYYMGYDSHFNALYIDEMDKLSDYDNYYSANNYKAQTITPGDKELIFEMHSNGKEKIGMLTFAEVKHDAMTYDVYISQDGRESSFTHVGMLNALRGVNKMELDGSIMVNGDFALKLVRSESEMDDAEKMLDYVTVYTTNYQEVAPDPGPNPEPTENTYALTFDANGGNFGGETTKTASCTTTDPSCKVSVVIDMPAKEGLKFIGWADSQSATEPSYYVGNNLTLTANKTIYAVYASGEIIWRQGQRHEIDSAENLVVSIDVPLVVFKEVKIDGVTVDATNYSAASGSTVLTIDSAYVDTLSVGSHSLAALYKTPLTITTTFDVVRKSEEEPDVPKSSNAHLSELEVAYKVNGEERLAELQPAFDKDIFDYEVTIPEDCDKNAFEDNQTVVVRSVLEDDKASAESNMEALSDGLGQMTIIVTAEDGSKKTYIVTIYYLSKTPEVPDTGGGDGEDDNPKPDVSPTPETPSTPKVPNTGFIVVRKSKTQSSSYSLVVILTTIAFGCCVYSIKKNKNRNSQFEFVAEN